MTLMRPSDQAERWPEFAYLIAHDLKDPLRQVTLHSELLQEALRAGDMDALAPLVENIRSETEMAIGMIGAVFGRAGDDDHTTWEGIGLALGPLLGAPTGFDLRWEGDFEFDPATAVQLQYIIRNLVCNALRHHDKDTGRITVRGDGDAIEVCDDGPGFAVDDARKAYGLGLSIVDRLVTGRGGRFSLEPVAERGTRVRFTWPSQPSRQSPLPPTLA